MNLFSPILRLFGIGGLSNSDRGAQVASSATIETEAAIDVTDERAMKVSAVWSCVQLITNSVCSIPLDFYEKEGEGRKELDRHPLVDLFKRKPNQWMKPRDLRKALTFQLALWQNAYAHIERGKDKRPISIMPLRPGRMVPHIEDDGRMTYRYSTEKGIVVYAPESILHLKGFGPDGIVGLDRTSYARNTLGVSVSADVYASKQFANGGRPGGGFLMLDNFLTPEQRLQARKNFAGMSETAYNTNKIWILEGGAKYQADTVNPDDMQMLQTRAAQVGEVARFFGVPEVLLGTSGTTAAWPASFEQQLLAFLTFTIQDYLDEWEHALSYATLTTEERRRIIIDHDTSGFIRMDSQAKALLQSTWVQNGLKTRNEIRKMNNDPEVTGGDELTVQVNLAPITELASAVSPGTASGEANGN